MSFKCPVGHYCATHDCFCPRDVPAPARRRVAAPVKIARQRVKVKTGKHITIAAIARDLGLSPRECRAALRAFRIAKPAHGWAWPPSEAAIIRGKIAKKFSNKIAPSKSGSRLTPMAADAHAPAPPMINGNANHE